jgi:TonB family C-terminal domain
VTVEFTITLDGSVKDIIIVSAEPPRIFDNEVLKAVNRWKFSPQTRDGKTVELRARQDIRFTLKK